MSGFEAIYKSSDAGSDLCLVVKTKTLGRFGI
jgi:hypothetical protein